MIKSVRWFAIGYHPHEQDGLVWSSPFESKKQAQDAIPNAAFYAAAEVQLQLPCVPSEGNADGIKVRPINVGDLITVDSDTYKVLKIGPRNEFEMVNAHLLGQGIIAEKDGKKHYFIDIDIDAVNGESIFY